MTDILSFAINLEDEGIQYYEKLASEAPSHRLSRIFEVLADEERRHVKAIEALQNQSPEKPPISGLLADARAVFSEIVKDGFQMNPEDDMATQYAAAYKAASDAERKNMELYLQCAKDAKDSRAKEVFLELAAQEKQHLILVDILFKLVTQPLKWTQSEEYQALSAM